MSLSVSIALLLTAMATFVLPVLFCIAFLAKKKMPAVPFFLGAAAFFLSQIVLRLPILSALSGQAWFAGLPRWVVIIVFGGLTAGLFEESARLVGAKCFLKKKLSFRTALAFGLGHGLCETVLLSGLNSMTYFIVSLVLQMGAGSVLAAAVPDLVQAVMTLSAGNVYLGMLERVSAAAFHVFATMLVFRGAAIGETLSYYTAAVFAHTLFNGILIIVDWGVPVWALEIILALLAAAGCVYVDRLRRTWEAEEPSAPSAGDVPPDEMPEKGSEYL